MTTISATAASAAGATLYAGLTHGGVASDFLFLVIGVSTLYLMLAFLTRGEVQD